MNRLFPALLLGIVVLICLACNPTQQPAVSSTPTLILAPEKPTSTSTPTPAPVLPAGDTPTPTVTPTSRPTSGEIEVRFSDPDTQGECEAHFQGV